MCIDSCEISHSLFIIIFFPMPKRSLESSADVKFSADQLERGLVYLHKTDFYHEFAEFSIPESWHQAETVDCLDLFRMTKRTHCSVSYDQGPPTNAQEDEEEDMLDGLLATLSEPPTCSTAAEYVYAMLIYVKEHTAKAQKKLMKAREENSSICGTCKRDF